MKTIVEPRDSIDKLWGKQQVREGETYRLMRYVLRVEHEDKVLLQNVVTGHLAVLDREEAELLETLPATYTPAMEQLVTDHYLVPQTFDEYRSVNQLRKIFQIRDTGDYINHYVILPTTFCNAHCFYCYESDYPRVHMTEETASKLIEYIDEHRQGKNITIQWFGGEPLLGAERIDQICRGLKDRNISFTSSMISNGYLLDEETVKKCIDLWNLNRIQITLDGTEEVYNRIKAYAGAADSSFQRVLRNIDLLSESKINTTIRLNLDFYNKDDICLLIDELGKRYNSNRYVGVYLNMLFNDQGYDPVHHSVDDMIALAQIIDDYTERLKEYHIGLSQYKIPSLQVRQCMADNLHTIMVQPDGGFCRCEHESVLECYGSMAKGVFDKAKLINWQEAIERSDHCHECNVYPYCYVLRNCINAFIQCDERYRLRNQKGREALFRSLYLKYLEGKKDEKISAS